MSNEELRAKLESIINEHVKKLHKYCDLYEQQKTSYYREGIKQIDTEIWAMAKMIQKLGFTCYTSMVDTEKGIYGDFTVNV